MWSTVVQWFPRSPVGVAEEPLPGPLEVALSIRGQAHPQVNDGVVEQGGDEGWWEGKGQAQVAHSEPKSHPRLLTLLQVVGHHGQDTSLCLTLQLGRRPRDSVGLREDPETLK